MLHEPAANNNIVDNAMAYKARLGIIMFVIYALVYAGFVFINTASPVTMEVEVFLGLNLAVVYGFGLILFALVLAVIYNAMCTAKEKAVNTVVEEKK